MADVTPRTFPQLASTDTMQADPAALKVAAMLRAMPANELAALARFIEQDPHRSWCWRVLGRNRHSAAIRAGALRDLSASIASSIADVPRWGIR